jgi:hypothetical protein
MVEAGVRVRVGHAGGLQPEQLVAHVLLGSSIAIGGTNASIDAGVLTGVVGVHDQPALSL